MSTETAVSPAAFSPLVIPVLAETEQEQAALSAARSRGYATGFAEGRRAAADEQAAWLEQAEAARAAQEAQAAARTAVLAQALRTAAAELSAATVPVLAEVEEVLVEAAFELATAVVGVALDDRIAAAKAAVARALSGETAGAVAVVRVNPEDAALLAGLPLPQLVADPALAPGDAIGELPAGWLDARVSTALARAREALS